MYNKRTLFFEGKSLNVYTKKKEEKGKRKTSSVERIEIKVKKGNEGRDCLNRRGKAVNPFFCSLICFVWGIQDIIIFTYI